MATSAGELPGSGKDERPKSLAASTSATVTEIVAELQAGRIVIIVDAEDRENEGDLVLLAEFADPESINFMARYGRGLICLAMSEGLCKQLDLPLMTHGNNSKVSTNFTVSIDASSGISTGISAADRSRTIQSAVRPGAMPSDLVKPGHVFPLMARPGGVLERAGHTEAACDLAELAGTAPAAVVCEIMKDNGDMARLPDLLDFATRYSLKVGTIADLIAYRIKMTSLVDRVHQESDFRTTFGNFRLITFKDVVTGSTHVAFVKGEMAAGKDALVRVHNDGFSALDILDLNARGHTWSVRNAFATIGESDCGVLVVLNCEEGVRDVSARLRYPRDRPETQRSKSEIRDYGIGAQILRQLGVTKMRLLGRPRKMPNMAGFGLSVTGYIASEE